MAFKFCEKPWGWWVIFQRNTIIIGEILFTFNKLNTILLFKIFYFDILNFYFVSNTFISLNILVKLNEKIKNN